MVILPLSGPLKRTPAPSRGDRIADDIPHPLHIRFSLRGQRQVVFLWFGLFAC